MIELYPVGSNVEVKLIKVPGIVTGVTIRKQDYVLYEVSYCVGEDVQTKWFTEDELHFTFEKQATIGFKVV